MKRVRAHRPLQVPDTRIFDPKKHRHLTTKKTGASSAGTCQSSLSIKFLSAYKETVEGCVPLKASLIIKPSPRSKGRPSTKLVTNTHTQHLQPRRAHKTNKDTQIKPIPKMFRLPMPLKDAKIFYQYKSIQLHPLNSRLQSL